MRGGAILFAVAAAACGALWGLQVLPIHREAAAAALEMERADIAGARSRASAWPGPDAGEARRLQEALALLGPTPLAADPPQGIHPDPSGPGAWSGSLPWAQVQDLFAWASSRPERLLSLRVSASPETPDRALCRVAFAPEGSR